MAREENSEALRARIANLETQLRAEKNTNQDSIENQDNRSLPSRTPATASHPRSIHNLLLLSDTALPLGSFAYSSGLESFLAHQKSLSPSTNPIALFPRFLNLSVQSIAFTNLPYVLATYRHPATLTQLDNDLDASTLCTVARKASVNQGRALLSVWEKSFVPAIRQDVVDITSAVEILDAFSRQLKSASSTSETLTVNGHLAPLWGVVCVALGLTLEDAGYLFLVNHAKAVLSAAVRASVMGPYLAQTILAGQELQELVRGCLQKAWDVQPEDAGQVVPIIDMWIGRHELLYSRIFNS